MTARQATEQKTAFHYERDPNAVQLPEKYKNVHLKVIDGKSPYAPVVPVSKWTRRKEKLLCKTANALWYGLQGVNKVLGEGKAFQPKWAPAPLLKSHERTKPPLGRSE